MAGSQLLLLVLATYTYMAREINATDLPPSNCPDKCGNVSIPYPFGIGEGCYLDQPGGGYGDFSINCDNSTGAPQPRTRDDLLVLNITLETAEMVVSSASWDAVVNSCQGTSQDIVDTITKNENKLVSGGYSLGAPYLLSPTGNMFTAIGCVSTARISGSIAGNSTPCSDRPNYKTGCITFCESLSDAAVDGEPCKGRGCCEASITPGLTSFVVGWDEESVDVSDVPKLNKCQYAFVAQKGWYKFKHDHLTRWDIENTSIPFVLDWAIRNGSACPPETKHDGRPFGKCLSNHSKCTNANSGMNGYFCTCSEGYSGNPYQQYGCKDIDECRNQTVCNGGKCYNTEGGYKCGCKLGERHLNRDDNKSKCEPIFPMPAIVVIATVILVSLVLVLLMFILLERKKRKLRDYFNRNGGQLLKSIKIDIFTKEKLDQITNNYSTIIGKGGFGKVYMGTINGNVRVAVKRSITINEARQKDFANEITIQSQISHRNLVKLLGCCLETDVPMLVYEFVPRGSLYDVLHGKNNSTRHPLSLRARLDIAVNSADALAYMHSYARQKIIHGDVKSGNILLDENFMPKVSDFGTSRLMTIGKDHTTFIVGDMSYIDPVYMKTGLLTEKSDVYSFGIVLLELMTGNKARYSGNNSLPINFGAAYKTESRAYEMYDRGIMSSEEDIKCIQNVGSIAVHCLKDDVDERPAMTEVVKDLQMVQSALLQSHGRMEHDLTDEICI